MRDIPRVMFLGHENIRNTPVHTHLVDFGSDDYVCKVATVVEEAQKLIESGFDYLTDFVGSKLIRTGK